MTSPAKETPAALRCAHYEFGTNRQWDDVYPELVAAYETNGWKVGESTGRTFSAESPGGNVCAWYGSTEPPKDPVDAAYVQRWVGYDARFSWTSIAATASQTHSLLTPGVSTPSTPRTPVLE